ncbi:MAG TPA: hypothetical protein VFF65_01570 [Phycisphaerales bacterium]|nr:hypothetical protein [Phycisphaerales bacterium]
MKRSRKTVARIAKWAAIGLAVSWVQAALAAWLFAPPMIHWPTYPGLKIGDYPGRGGPASEAAQDGPRRMQPDDLGVLGRWAARTFFSGPRTVFAVDTDPAAVAAGRSIYYQIAVERSGWPLRCWDTWHGAGDKVLFGLRITGPGARRNNGPISTAPLALPLVPVVETVWLSAAFWGLAAFGATALVRRRLAALRLPAGSCPVCGYNRAGLSKGAPCPECGNSAAAPRNRSA